MMAVRLLELKVLPELKFRPSLSAAFASSAFLSRSEVLPELKFRPSLSVVRHP